MWQEREIPGIGSLGEGWENDFDTLEQTEDGRFKAGCDGVEVILSPRDRKVELIVFAEHTLARVRSQMGHPALYPLEEAAFEPPAEAVLMDLDGTSVDSEEFWIWVIEQSTAALRRDPTFRLEEEDLPHVSGHSVSEHLQYCISNYAPGHTVEMARHHYFEITRKEMRAILEGRGRPQAFRPAPGLKDFLLALKGRGVKIGLVTSGLYEKAWPEIVTAFRTLEMGDPLAFYDAIMTAGFQVGRPEQPGTLGELCPKPHPWLYAETARIGLGLKPEDRRKVVGIEDSSAGVMSIRLAGFSAVGIDGGNIAQSGVQRLVHAQCRDLEEVYRVIMGT